MQQNCESTYDEQELQLLIKQTNHLYISLKGQWLRQCGDNIIWIIPNFKFLFHLHKFTAIKTSKSLVSPCFDLTTGHRFRLRLFLNGANAAEGRYLSLYAQTMKTEKLKDVTYPFNGVITTIMIDSI